MKSIYIACFALLGLSMTSAAQVSAAEKVFACPDLSTAEQVGTCPTDKELKEGYDGICPSVMAKQQACVPFAAYAKGKSKALWAAQSGSVEFLSYVDCGLSPKTVRASRAKALDVNCTARSGRCEALCTYDNDFTLKLRVKGDCRTATQDKIDCSDDPASCVVKCVIEE